MTLSNRLKNLPPHFFSSLVRNVEQALAEGRDVINLGRGNPDQPTPPHIVKALQEAVEDPATHGYSPFRGIAEFKQAAADFYKREYNVDIDPKTEVAVLFGTKPGLVELPLALMNEGELLLLPDPGYPDYLSSVSLANINYDTIPLLAENNFLPDYSKLSDEQKKAKLMYLNYPNNPTSATATIPFLKRQSLWLKRMTSQLCMTLLMVVSVLTVKNLLAFCRQKVLKRSELKCTPCQRRIIWPAGALVLLSEMLTLFKPSVPYKIIYSSTSSQPFNVLPPLH